jgi:hypothetical protein
MHLDPKNNPPTAGTFGVLKGLTCNAFYPRIGDLSFNAWTVANGLIHAPPRKRSEYWRSKWRSVQTYLNLAWESNRPPFYKSRCGHGHQDHRSDDIVGQKPISIFVQRQTRFPDGDTGTSAPLAGCNCMTHQQGQMAMTKDKLPDHKLPNDKMQGEGNYDAARKYDEEATKFAKDEKKVKQAADLAKEALEGPEREELEAAEKRGKEHDHR